MISRTRGLTVSGVWVAAGRVGGIDVGEAPPSGVGVTYCPHRDAFSPAPHAEVASKNDAAIKRLMSRFTK